MKQNNNYHIDIIINNGFSMFELASILEPFSMAANSIDNLILETNIYSNDGLTKQSDCLSGVSTKHIGTRDYLPNIVFILSGCQSSFASSLLYKKLQHCMQDSNCIIVAVNEGIQWLYQCNVIGKDYVHNGILEAPDTGPARLKKGRLYSIRNNIALCAGGSACLDMALKLISIIHDKDLSISTAEKLACSMIRSSKHHRFETETNSITWPQELKDAVEIMKQTISNPLSIPELYRYLGITAYHLHLLFKQHISISPNEYYNELRLMRVQELLSETNLSMEQIAQQTGYGNLNTLYNRFKKRYGASPFAFKKYSAF